MKLDIDRLNLVSGDEKRFLEKFIGLEAFVQRYDFDEYCVVKSEVNLELDLDKLIILSNMFEVNIVCGYLSLSPSGLLK